MPDTLEEQILDLVVSKLADITEANGYEQDLSAANIRRPSESSDQFSSSSDCPGVSVRNDGKSTRWHLRGADEVILGVRMICYATSRDNLEKLMGDVKKLWHANELWNDGSSNLAVRSWIEDDDPHEEEAARATVSGQVLGQIIYRVDQADPSSVKAI